MIFHQPICSETLVYKRKLGTDDIISKLVLRTSHMVRKIYDIKSFKTWPIKMAKILTTTMI